MTTDEVAFLAGIRAEPRDDLRRLVYADWLEEQADDQCRAKAEYLRLEVHVSGLPDDHPERDGHILKLRAVAEKLPLEWKAEVEKLVLVEWCETVWRSACPKRWEHLSSTDDPTLRFCAVCRLEVHYCGSSGGARTIADAGHPVAVDLSVFRSPGDLAPHWTGGVLTQVAPVGTALLYQVPVHPNAATPNSVQTPLTTEVAVTTSMGRPHRAASDSDTDVSRPPPQPGLLRRLWRKLTGK